MNYYIKWVLSIFGILLVSFFILTLISILYAGLNDKIHKSDVAIIFGSKVNPDGVLSDRLRARLNKGIELYQKNVVGNIIVSGGTGIEGVDEAIAMKNYLITQHIPDSAIITDSYGNTTEATAMNSAKLMQLHGFKSALIVSQYFHIKRASMALEKCGIFPVYSAHANYFEWRDLYSTSREVVAYYSYLFIRRKC